MKPFRFTLLPAFLLALFLSPPVSLGWDYYRLQVKPKSGEAAWRDALAEQLGGKAEVPIEGGRIDVLTEQWAVEVDRPHNWHEGLGQAIHYADATGHQGVLAIIAYAKAPDTLRQKSLKRFSLVDNLCKKNNIKLVLLFPGEEKGPQTTGLTKGPTLPKADVGNVFWLNTSSNIRHNNECRFFTKTYTGHFCEPNEGRACTQCGG